MFVRGAAGVDLRHAIVYDSISVYKVQIRKLFTPEMPEYRHIISAAALETRLEDPAVRVLDCRYDLADADAGRSAYLDGHIAGAVFADLERDLSAPVTAGTGRHPLPTVAEFTQTLSRLGIDEKVDVVAYDAGNGAMAARAWWMLRWLGHDKVRLLDGGFAQWMLENRPTRNGHEAAIPRTFQACPRDDLIITTGEIARHIGRIGLLRIVDARDAIRFRGEVEPIDPIAGHIPGSMNLPLTDSLNEDGSWKSPAELGALWRDLLGNDPGVPWCVMCGSGVTACHLAISGMEAGLVEPRLYVGSWSEWIRDPGRPIGAAGD